MVKPKIPKALDAIADVVLRYRPKPKSEPAKQRRRKRRKLEKQNGGSVSVRLSATRST